MRKSFFLALVFFPIVFLGVTQIYSQELEKYSRVKVYATKTQSQKLLSKGVCFDELAEKKDSYFIGDFSAKEISLMKEERLRVDVVIDDLTQDFLKRNEKDAASLHNLRTGGTPPGFTYGSMGGYLTFSQMVAELDELKTMYPNLVSTKSSIGTTAEGRAIWMVKISDNPDVEDASEEGVFYGSLYHAREPISMVSLLYFMQYILSQYGTDPEITCLINNRELYFVPCANPDGYVYNQTTNPNGGGFWRKNRRNNGDGTFGVDLNRNFDYNWGFDNNGSSSITSSEVYRGPAAGSEIETSAIKNFISSNQLSMALNTHTYANKVIFPFEYNSSATPNESHYNSVASMLTYENKYLYGKNMQMVGYNANGTTDDWMYSNNLYSFTVETGSEADGFWPVQSRIIPICEQNLDLNISAAWAAGNYIKPRVAPNLYVSGLSYNLPISITNYGNSLGTLETVSLSISDPRVLLYDALPELTTGLLPDDTWTVFKNITFSPLATNGTINANLIVTNLEGCTYTIPFSFEYSPNGCFGIPSLWTALDIGLPGLLGASCLQNGIYTIKGSGIGGLATTSDKCHMMKLATNTDVWEIKARVVSTQNLSSNSKAGITISENSSAGAKRVTLLVNPSANRIEFQKRSSTNGSISTMNVTGQGALPKWLRIVKSSGGNYIGYYSNNGTSWTQIGKHKVTFPTNITAGIVVTSGLVTLLNTSTFDNLAVSTPGGTLTRTIGLPNIEFESGENDKADKFTIYPNPTKGILEVRLPASVVDQTVSVFDINGKEVLKTNMGSGYKQLNLSHLSNGLYYIRYKEGTRVKYEKFILNK